MRNFRGTARESAIVRITGIAITKNASLKPTPRPLCSGLMADTESPLREDHTELYDLQSDPAELRNVAAQHPELVREMRADLLHTMKVVVHDKETLEQLRALGYVN